MGNTMTPNAELLKQLQKTERNTPAAAEIMGALWENNLPLIRKTVRWVTGLSDYDDGFGDMVQQAYFSLASAAYSYNAFLGTEFSTHLVNRIKWGLYRYHDNTGYTVRIPSSMRQKINACLEKKRQMEIVEGREVSFAEAIKASGFSPDDTMAAIQKLKTVSLESSAEDQEGHALQDVLPSDENLEEDVVAREWQHELHELLFAALDTLDDDVHQVIDAHYFQGVAVSALSKRLGCGRHAIYFMEQSAFRCIRSGEYGKLLAEFMPDMRSKDKAEWLIQRDRSELERLQLSDREMDLIAI